jgi:hypothetical protein
MSFDPITAGIDLVKDVGGKIVDHFFPDPEQAAKAQLELNKLAQDGKIQEWVQDNEHFKNEVADRQSARDRESAIATSDAAPTLSKLVTPILALGTVAIGLFLFGAVLFQTGLIDPSRKDLAIYILGALTTAITQILSYYFGSSDGSSKKNALLEDMMKK